MKKLRNLINYFISPNVAQSTKLETSFFGTNIKKNETRGEKDPVALDKRDYEDKFALNFKGISFFNTNNEISKKKVFFPLNEDKMYGGAVMAKAICDLRNGSYTANNNVLSFQTEFLKPIKSNENLIHQNDIISEGRTLRWIKSSTSDQSNNLSNTKILLQKNRPEAVNNDVHVLGSLNESFYEFLIGRFHNLDKNHKDELSHSFIKSTSDVLNLQVISSDNDCLKLSYSVSTDVKDSLVKAFIIYYIDVIIVSYTSLIIGKPIFDKDNVFISSVNQQMCFINNETPRSGYICLNKKYQFKETAIYNISATFYDTSNNLFAEAVQNVYADTIKSNKNEIRGNESKIDGALSDMIINKSLQEKNKPCFDKDATEDSIMKNKEELIEIDSLSQSQSDSDFDKNKVSEEKQVQAPTKSKL